MALSKSEKAMASRGKSEWGPVRNHSSLNSGLWLYVSVALNHKHFADCKRNGIHNATSDTYFTDAPNWVGHNVQRPSFAISRGEGDDGICNFQELLLDGRGTGVLFSRSEQGVGAAHGNFSFS